MGDLVGLFFEISLLMIDGDVVEVMGEELGKADLVDENLSPLSGREVDVFDGVAELLADNVRHLVNLLPLAEFVVFSAHEPLAGD